MTDEQLALAYVQGNTKAFDVLLQRNQSKVFSYIMFVVRNQDVANDLFQDTFMKVITRLQQGKYVDSGKFSAWVMRIAHNIIMDWYRQQKAEPIVSGPEDNDLSRLGSTSFSESSIESTFVNEQVMRDVRTMMKMLPPLQREVVFMRFYQGLSFKEIAEMTGVSINTALGRMRYALLNMRKMAKKHDIALQLM